MDDNEQKDPDVLVKIHVDENLAEFCVKRQITDKIAMFTKGVLPGPDPGSLAADCLAVDGVESVGIFPYEVLVGKAEMFPWEPLCEAVAGIVADEVFATVDRYQDSDKRPDSRSSGDTIDSRIRTIDEEFKDFFLKK